MQIPIKAHICTMKEIRTKDTYYFWGEKISEEVLHRTYAPSGKQCEQMIHERKLDGIGYLKQRGPSFASTTNRKKHQYQWCQTTSTSTKNAYLEEITAYWDLTTGTIQSHLFTKTNCEYNKQICSSPEGTLIWNNNMEQLCSYTFKKEIFNGKATFYNNASDINKKAIIIPELEMAVYDLKIPHPNVTKCFDRNSTKLNSETGFLFIISNCTVTEGKRTKRSLDNEIGNPELMATQLNFVSNQHNKDIKILQQKFNYILCQMQNEIQFNQRLLSKLYPSEIMSRYLQAQREAASYGDVLIEKLCHKANLTLIKSLRMNNKSFALRPIAQYMTGNETKIVQHKMGNVWQMGVTKTDRETTGYVNYEINGKEISYLNSEMIREPLPIKGLSLTMRKIAIEQQIYDFEKSALQLQEIKDQSIQTMLTRLETLKLYGRDNHQEGELDQNEWEFDTTNSIWTPIKHPAWTIFTTVINLLSHLWAIVWTIIIIAVIVKLCNDKRSNQ